MELSLIAPLQVVLTRRIRVGDEVSVLARAWRGKHRLFPRFSFVSSRPGVAEVTHSGPDWAALRGRSPGRTEIVARVGHATARLVLRICLTDAA